jgi:hypothetical protein
MVRLPIYFVLYPKIKACIVLAELASPAPDRNRFVSFGGIQRQPNQSGDYRDEEVRTYKDVVQGVKLLPVHW